MGCDCVTLESFGLINNSEAEKKRREKGPPGDFIRSLLSVSAARSLREILQKSQGRPEKVAFQRKSIQPKKK